MKNWFIVLAKLLGLVQLYFAVLGALQLMGMFLMTLPRDGNLTTSLLAGGLGILVYLAVALAIAWVLCHKTEWLAEKVGLRDGEGVANFSPAAALSVGVALIGLLMVLQALPHVARILLEMQRLSSATELARPLRRDLIPTLAGRGLQLLLGASLAGRPGTVAALLAARQNR